MNILEGRSKDAPADAGDFADLYIDSVAVIVSGVASSNDPDLNIESQLRRFVEFGRRWPSEYRDTLAGILRDGFKTAGVPFPDLALVSEEQYFSDGHLSQCLEDAVISSYGLPGADDDELGYTSRDFYPTRHRAHDPGPIECLIQRMLTVPDDSGTVSKEVKSALQRKYFGLVAKRMADQSGGNIRKLKDIYEALSGELPARSIVAKGYRSLSIEPLDPEVIQWRAELCDILTPFLPPDTR
ncbi:hypothetical protein [Paraburkholderia sediminicola]|uniref:hypothetical protein n=1 Tax=Paraburkholderia sediminicola TaxID=458836 RepID=UPI0038BBE47E